MRPELPILPSCWCQDNNYKIQIIYLWNIIILIFLRNIHLSEAWILGMLQRMLAFPVRSFGSSIFNFVSCFWCWNYIHFVYERNKDWSLIKFPYGWRLWWEKSFKIMIIVQKLNSDSSNFFYIWRISVSQNWVAYLRHFIFTNWKIFPKVREMVQQIRRLPCMRLTRFHCPPPL